MVRQNDYNTNWGLLQEKSYFLGYNQNMGVTFFAILLRIISNSMSNVYQKQLTAKAIDPFLINFIMYLGLTICCIPIVIRTTFLTFPHQIWTNAILGGDRKSVV